MKEIIKYFDKEGNECSREDKDLYRIVKQTIDVDKLVKEEIFIRDNNS